jgi:excisionase family DNA binding protein
MLLTAKQVAEMLNISESLVYKLADSFELQSIKIRDCVRFYPESVENFMRNNVRKSENQPERIVNPNFRSPYMM